MSTSPINGEFHKKTYKKLFGYDSNDDDKLLQISHQMRDAYLKSIGKSDLEIRS